MFDDILNYKLKDCWATPTNDTNDIIRFDLSNDGCPAHDWIEMKNASCISFPLFGFANSPKNLYVHCKINICTEDSTECEPTSSATCAANRKAADSAGGRKRRHADSKTTMVSSLRLKFLRYF